ncbi:MAG: ATP-binding protein, partial [Hyphomicrobiales bacterium]
MHTQTADNAPHIDTGERIPLGRIVSISGSQAVVLVHDAERMEGAAATPPELGTLLKIETPNSFVLGLISALSVPVPSQDPNVSEMRIVELEFVGEMVKDDAGAPQLFRRGVSSYPSLGQEVYQVSQDTLGKVYACDAVNSVRIGTILQAPAIPAVVRTDELLGKHLAVLGATGSGKSCSVALLLRNILEQTPNAHILLLDPHREYAPAFGDMAEVVTADNLNLPFWLLTFEEVVEILIGNCPGHETDVETLRELIPIAKSRYGINQRRGDRRSMLSKPEDGPSPSVDTPVPYRISDIVALLEELIGRLELRGELAPYKRLKARIETISRDPRFAFMFGNLTVQDTMAEFLGRIFRVPVGGKPVTLIELAGLPSEIINVVVSVLSRMSFDFAHWSGGQVPITLVCEEAHRYVPMDTSLGFEPAKRALSKIAKEGRKYGVSLCIVSQRPAELDPTILSQCATIFGMRLPNERDQEILRARVSDASASLLDVLPTLGTGEAVAFGEGVALPTRIRFDRLRPDAMPRSTTARFSQVWQNEVGSRDFMQDVVARWRAHSSGVVPPDPAAGTDLPDGPALPSHDEASDLAVPEPQPAPPPAKADPAPAAQA